MLQRRRIKREQSHSPINLHPNRPVGGLLVGGHEISAALVAVDQGVAGRSDFDAEQSRFTKRSACVLQLLQAQVGRAQVDDALKRSAT
jgi:hypothetical protein